MQFCPIQHQLQRASWEFTLDHAKAVNVDRRLEVPVDCMEVRRRVIAKNPDEERSPQPSPEGSWILYLAWSVPKGAAPPSEARLMRIPLGGGLARAAPRRPVCSARRRRTRSSSRASIRSRAARRSSPEVIPVNNTSCG